jgi:hypothetical protein
MGAQTTREWRHAVRDSRLAFGLPDTDAEANTDTEGGPLDTNTDTVDAADTEETGFEAAAPLPPLLQQSEWEGEAVMWLSGGLPGGLSAAVRAGVRGGALPAFAVSAAETGRRYIVTAALQSWEGEPCGPTPEALSADTDTEMDTDTGTDTDMDSQAPEMQEEDESEEDESQEAAVVVRGAGGGLVEAQRRLRQRMYGLLGIPADSPVVEYVWRSEHGGVVAGALRSRRGNDATRARASACAEESAHKSQGVSQ